jgi:hypothetical protein
MEQQQIEEALARGYEYCRTKADQHLVFAGIAQITGNTENEQRHMESAKEYEELCEKIKSQTWKQ